MVSERYNFVNVELKNGEVRKEPRLPIILRNPHNGKTISGLAIVDTGADCCAFSRHACDALGHHLDSPFAKKAVSYGIGEVPVQTWLHTFEISLLGWHGHPVWYTEAIEVECFESVDVLLIIGVSGFLEHFKVTFDYPELELILEN